MGLKNYLKEFQVVDNYLTHRNLNNWIRAGRPQPPPHAAKVIAVTYYGIAHGHDVLIETGTYLGDMIWAQKDHFKIIYSIELSKTLFDRAKIRFRRFEHIHLINGDSSEKIADIMPKLSEPALFWLDGHYSGGETAKGRTNCPIFQELEQIFASSMQNTILIDDARCFNGTEDYPTLSELNSFIAARSKYGMRLENDVIVLTHPDSFNDHS